MLAECYEFNQMEGRCLAFRRAASVLKSLPRVLSSLEDTHHLPCLGDHAKAIIDVRFPPFILTSYIIPKEPSQEFV